MEGAWIIMEIISRGGFIDDVNLGRAQASALFEDIQINMRVLRTSVLIALFSTKMIALGSLIFHYL